MIVFDVFQESLRRFIGEKKVSMTQPKSKSFRFFLFLLIAAVGFLADIATKHWIFAKLGRPGERPVYWIIDGVFGFQTSLNQGALFGIGQGRVTLFVALSLVALAGIAWWVWVDYAKSVFLSSTLGLIGAGILGNLWDRVGLHHMTWTQFDVDVWSCDAESLGRPVYAVRDWILVMIGSYHWPNFNIADAALVSGVTLMILRVFLTPNPERERELKEVTG